MNVGELKLAIADMSDDMEIIMQIHGAATHEVYLDTADISEDEEEDVEYLLLIGSEDAASDEDSSEEQSETE